MLLKDADGTTSSADYGLAVRNGCNNYTEID